MALAVALLEESFDLIAPQGDRLMDVFYRRLFADAPATGRLFAETDMGRQKKALLGTLAVLRHSLRNVGAIVPALQALGQRHAGYGVERADYPLVGAALLAAMAEVGGPTWRPEFTSAWADAYQVVQGAMLAGTSANAIVEG